VRRLVLCCVLSLVAALAAAPAVAGEQRSRAADARLEAYTATVDAAQIAALRADGYDVTVLSHDGADATVELVLTPRQRAALARQGISARLHRTASGQTSTQAAAAALAQQEGVFRPYSGPGGLEEEIRQIAADNPRLVKLVKVGESLQGKDILALKLTQHARSVPDGTRPAALYLSTQHAREWITPEMTRRLVHWFLDHTGDPEIARLLQHNEYWFLIVANPDGYDHTFTEGGRMWRKNLRDVDGDGEIGSGDGVDLNRNFPTNWGYDDEGSADDPTDETYRGEGPASEPEVQAMDALMARIDPEFVVNYHSAAELLLYGNGWQVDTPSPDDLLATALAGDDAEPAIPGYDPDQSAELYITNGDTIDHAHNTYGAIAFTPEMSTCQSVADDPSQCGSVFHFPDDEAKIQAEFEKNLPFALDIAMSASDPANPVSHLGNTAPVFDVDAFAESWGTPQTVAAFVKRGVGRPLVEYRVDGGRRQIAQASEWDGGERYGDDFDVYYARMRAEIPGLEPGDTVEVTWRAGNHRAEPFTFTVRGDSDADVLVLAEEDYTGASPAQDPDGPHHLDAYTDALDANGVAYDVYDVDAEGRVAPHPLGVLSHYDAVVWYTGDDLVVRDGDEPGYAVSKLQHDVTMAVRAFLNEGGKVSLSGKNAGVGEFFGLYYGTNGAPEQTCVSSSPDDECLPLSNDVHQYYFGLGQLSRFAGLDADGEVQPVVGIDTPLEGLLAELDGPDSAGNQGDGTTAFMPTSNLMPAEEFPLFTSWRSALWDTGAALPYEPLTGDWYVASDHDDRAYKRISRTIDLGDATSASLEFSTSYAIEGSWDHMFVEAHPVDSDDWTTLPDANGHTSQAPGESCASGWSQEVHPFLQHYVTVNADGSCSPTGTTGEWHATTGISDGWEDWSIDLSAYAGQEVEVSITYATDWFTGDLGAFIDDTAVIVDGETAAETSFESDMGGWSVPGSPEGSDPNDNDWFRTEALYEFGAAVTTEDTIAFGFGLEGVDGADARADLMGRVLDHILP